ncbi:MAG: hypothetical protein ACI4S4_03660, partial [Candidatus Ornithospirochaeta sp.]
SLRVMNWESDKAKAISSLDYANMILENEKTLYSLGLSTSASLAEKENDVAQAQKNVDKVMLEGHSLQRDLEIFAL